MSLKVVCVGAGWVTSERHIPALRRDGRVTVLGVVDQHPDRARALAARYQLRRWGTSLDEPWLGEAECITVGTPPTAHAELVATAIERGWHCLTEKPFALPAAKARDLAALAAARGVVIGVVHNFQFSRSGRRLFELVEGGELGRVEAVYGFQLSNPRRRLPQWCADLPGGLFLDEAPHLLYLLRRLLGGRLEPRTVDARLSGHEIRHLTAVLDHETVRASLEMSFCASVSEWQLVVVAERATVALDVFRDVLVRLPNDGGHRARDILRTSGALVGGHVAGVALSGARLVGRRLYYGNDEVVERFVDATEGQTERLRWLGADDGHAVVACLEQILEMAGATSPPAGRG